ncbi:hypothetical protein AUEXF2481DRAFT_685197 [Aureobasidium subglaciale EXF-2481]|uniref:Uncharacterized protein n=1 Tax=Aureobasidium subglaciale (strain EXF-2481) TaxID=1043005 RepID=A0A074YNW4_AURSE|nr:uncharacterized protein AUEXF2481DRAFT_685197 [Aureobasidium subglaciale EXF-2481]KEQ95757.1 hypothetical protein AUEXF2481DRAFT_685197 [Aureobasidium subglaciale EXF-2481]
MSLEPKTWDQYASTTQKAPTARSMPKATRSIPRPARAREVPYRKHLHHLRMSSSATSDLHPQRPCKITSASSKKRKRCMMTIISRMVSWFTDTTRLQSKSKAHLQSDLKRRMAKARTLILEDILQTVMRRHCVSRQTLWVSIQRSGVATRLDAALKWAEAFLWTCPC